MTEIAGSGRGQTVRAGEPVDPRWADEFDHVLEPTRGVPSLRLGELWQYRELLYFLAWRDITVRYKQTVLGVAWAVLQPVLAMILFTFVFAHVAKISSGGVPYELFSYAALVPWFFFATAVQLASTSLTVNPQLITKVYFPRIFLVTAPVVAGLVDFGLAFVVLIGLMAYYGVVPALGAFALVGFMLLAVVTTIGVGAWLAALNVRYRDVRFVVPFLLQLWLFATPVVYSTASLGEPWRTVYGINPMAGVVEGFRWALAGSPAPSASTLLLSIFSGLLVFVLGLHYFRRTEKHFADVI
ncbi:MAG TPA: ABC transporter permease [Gaiellaceae bacterium]|jgi:lipopolysaccharide transport system permease protein|nr:ABC transporter permease [Gaiellaceae bacterium]